MVHLFCIRIFGFTTQKVEYQKIRGQKQTKPEKKKEKKKDKLHDFLKHCVEYVRIPSFSGPYFLAFGLDFT